MGSCDTGSYICLSCSELGRHFALLHCFLAMLRVSCTLGVLRGRLPRQRMLTRTFLILLTITTNVVIHTHM